MWFLAICFAIFFACFFLAVSNRSVKKVKKKSVKLSNLSKEMQKLIHYRKYFLKTIKRLMKGEASPIGAYQTLDGKVKGVTFIATRKGVEVSYANILNLLEEKFEKLYKESEITSYVIFYHSLFKSNNTHTIREPLQTVDSISFISRFKGEAQKTKGIGYEVKDDGLVVEVLEDLEKTESNLLFNGPLSDHENLFHETLNVETGRPAIEIKTLPYSGLELTPVLES